jgi:hypothetical protein
VRAKYVPNVIAYKRTNQRNPNPMSKRHPQTLSQILHFIVEILLKEEFTHCELVAADSANGVTAADTVLDWYKRFGLPAEWVPTMDPILRMI